jgi:type II secretory pathway component PulK
MMQNKKGIALILAMFILVFVSILAVAFLWLITSDLMITSNHLGKLRALYIAEAGIEDAVSQLRANGNHALNIGPISLGSTGYYTVTYSNGTSRVIQSTGQVDNNQFTATIEAKVSIRQAGSYWTVRIVSFQETG